MSRSTCLAHPMFMVVLTALLTAPACAPEAARSENPSRGPDSTRSGGATGQGAGGSPAAPGGGGAGGGAAVPGAGGSVAAGDGGVAVPAGPVIPLPVIVTKEFDNQGWFADPALEMSFMPGSTVIRHGADTSGPCAGSARMMPTRGDCLKVVYTPPANVVPPMGGGWVGVFLLTTLLDPTVIGQPNWGTTGAPGKNIAPGATKISFFAAAAVDGQQVAFKAGTKTDSFVIEDQKQILGTAWKPFSIPLNGAMYGNNVFGGFAWVLTDTTKPATFYIDGIVWE